MPLLATYPTTAEAHIVAGMLENHGLHVTIQQNAVSSLFPAPDSGTFGISLWVPDAELERARRLIEEHSDR